MPSTSLTSTLEGQRFPSLQKASTVRWHIKSSMLAVTGLMCSTHSWYKVLRRTLYEELCLQCSLCACAKCPSCTRQYRQMRPVCMHAHGQILPLHDFEVYGLHCAGEILFGFIEENLNRAGTAGGRFINATVAVGQTFIIPQGQLTKLCVAHAWQINPLAVRS